MPLSPVDDSGLRPISRDWIAERLNRQGLLPPDADFPLYAHPTERKPVAAAVLVPVVNQPGGPTLLFTQRTSHLHDHAGQISFPGGRVDDGDADRVATALREAEEETGIDRSRVQVIGRLPDFDIRRWWAGWSRPSN